MSNNTNDLCVPTVRSSTVFSSWLVVYLLFFPIFLWVIYVGFRKCKASSDPSHSDVFTYHMVAMELLNLTGSCLYFAGFMGQFLRVLRAGLSLKHMASIGEMSFHNLTCVERYLAVVCPITYLRLKRGGVAIRNVSIGGAWLLSVMTFVLMVITESVTMPLIFGFGVAVFSTVLVSFCSVSVLWVLIRPGPGEGGAVRKRIDRSKRMAANTILLILGALLLRMVAVCFYYMASFQSQIEVCVVVLCTYWLAMPSSLVLPLLFLHRQGLIPGRRRVHKETRQTENTDKD